MKQHRYGSSFNLVQSIGCLATIEIACEFLLSLRGFLMNLIRFSASWKIFPVWNVIKLKSFSVSDVSGHVRGWEISGFWKRISINSSFNANTDWKIALNKCCVILIVLWISHCALNAHNSFRNCLVEFSCYCINFCWSFFLLLLAKDRQPIIVHAFNLFRRIEMGMRTT